MTQETSGYVRMGRWEVRSVPAGWFFVPDFGLRHAGPPPISNITVKDDSLLGGDKLEPYIKVQMDILRRTFLDPVFSGPQPSSLTAGEETMLLLIRHQTAEGPRLLQVQTYVRERRWIGIITLTTTEAKLAELRPDYEWFVRSLGIVPPQEAPAEIGAAEDGEPRPTA